MTTRADRQARRRAARKAFGLGAVRARQERRWQKRGGTALPAPAAPASPADSAATGRLTVIIGRDAYAELERTARTEGLTPAGLAGRMLLECLA